jgi:hypothetical protein
LQRHVGRGLFPYVLANDDLHASPEQPQLKPVALSHGPSSASQPDKGYQVIAADVVDRAVPWRHDAGKLAGQIVRFYDSHRASS